MTEVEMRIAIAEACGWVPLTIPFKVGRQMVDWPVWEKDGKIASLVTRTLPDYLFDLNAMHEAENTLKVGDQWATYYYHFVDLGGVKINATARQRAESFLRTLGKLK